MVFASFILYCDKISYKTNIFVSMKWQIRTGLWNLWSRRPFCTGGSQGPVSLGGGAHVATMCWTQELGWLPILQGPQGLGQSRGGAAVCRAELPRVAPLTSVPHTEVPRRIPSWARGRKAGRAGSGAAWASAGQGSAGWGPSEACATPCSPGHRRAGAGGQWCIRVVGASGPRALVREGGGHRAEAPAELGRGSPSLRAERGPGRLSLCHGPCYSHTGMLGACRDP